MPSIINFKILNPKLAHKIYQSKHFQERKLRILDPMLKGPPLRGKKQNRERKGRANKKPS